MEFNSDEEEIAVGPVSLNEVKRELKKDRLKVDRRVSDSAVTKYFTPQSTFSGETDESKYVTPNETASTSRGFLNDLQVAIGTSDNDSKSLARECSKEALEVVEISDESNNSVIIINDDSCTDDSSSDDVTFEGCIKKEDSSMNLIRREDFDFSDDMSSEYNRLGEDSLEAMLDIKLLEAYSEAMSNGTDFKAIVTKDNPSRETTPDEDFFIIQIEEQRAEMEAARKDMEISSHKSSLAASSEADDCKATTSESNDSKATTSESNDSKATTSESNDSKPTTLTKDWVMSSIFTEQHVRELDDKSKANASNATTSNEDCVMKPIPIIPEKGSDDECSNDAPLVFNDTLDEMEAMKHDLEQLDEGDREVPLTDEVKKASKKTAIPIACPKKLPTPNKYDYVASPVSDYIRRRSPRHKGFKMPVNPTKLKHVPSTRKVLSSFENVVSPIGVYIKNTPAACLAQSSKSTMTEKNFTISKADEPSTKKTSHNNLPMLKYTPGKAVERPIEKEAPFPGSLQKLTPFSAVGRHQTKDNIQNQSVIQRRLMQDDLTLNASALADVSVIETKKAVIN